MKNIVSTEESSPQRWGFKMDDFLKKGSCVTVRSLLTDIKSNINPADSRSLIPLGHGDPSSFPCFQTTPVAVEAIESALRSSKFNGYSPSAGIPLARKAIADYLSKDLKDKLSSDDVYLTIGCIQAIEVILSVLSSRPNANILLPKPGFPYYEVRASHAHLEVRHFDLMPEKNWEVDLDAVEALADENTVAIVIINPGNPCGNVFTYQHLNRIAETARKLGILIIADEVYNHLVFGNNPFISMGNFGSIAPVITVGSISKRWLVPGWRLGWLVTNDPQGILKKHGIIDSIIDFVGISSEPPTFIQGAIPQILERTNEDFFLKTVDILRECANICYDSLKNVPCITCPTKPEGSMFVMVKLDVSMLEDIIDDMDFCMKLAKEESVMILPGVALGLKNWLRVTFSIEPACLVDGLGRLNEFCIRHAKKK
ncbi:tyrosine aminotransferase-like isoform X1 [Impatiens glandulifera]|uniref:tyrosine aminotransferase-like isoform X1 n=1 Tax=Impatiens glandulifera TaxID=253017 RepID=UPI001FB13DA6|nr:tyrosine aminotransferase-like isoform X1 [Impatiens glandulifera]